MNRVLFYFINMVFSHAADLKHVKNKIKITIVLLYTDRNYVFFLFLVPYYCCQLLPMSSLSLLMQLWWWCNCLVMCNYNISLSNVSAQLKLLRNCSSVALLPFFCRYAISVSIVTHNIKERVICLSMRPMGDLAFYHCIQNHLNETGT